VFRKLATCLAVCASLLVAGCTSIAGTPTPPATHTSTATPTILTYAHVWGSQAPSPYHEAGLRLLADNIIPVQFLPRPVFGIYCSQTTQDNGWTGTACISDLRGRKTIYILDELTDPAAIENIKRHEAPHFVGWPETGTGQQCRDFELESPCDHPGAMKPDGHLDNCLRSMQIANLTPRRMADLCKLDEGAPLQPSDAARWAVLRVQYGL